MGEHVRLNMPSSTPNHRAPPAALTPSLKSSSSSSSSHSAPSPVNSSSTSSASSPTSSGSLPSSPPGLNLASGKQSSSSASGHSSSSLTPQQLSQQLHHSSPLLSSMFIGQPPASSAAVSAQSIPPPLVSVSPSPSGPPPPPPLPPHSSSLLMQSGLSSMAPVTSSAAALSAIVKQQQQQSANQSNSIPPPSSHRPDLSSSSSSGSSGPAPQPPPSHQSPYSQYADSPLHSLHRSGVPASLASAFSHQASLLSSAGAISSALASTLTNAKPPKSSSSSSMVDRDDIFGLSQSSYGSLNSVTGGLGGRDKHQGPNTPLMVNTNGGMHSPPSPGDYGGQGPSTPGSYESSMMQSNGERGSRKKQSTRDPLSHRMIEKRRRDRMNNCLTDLSRLIPNSFIKKSSSLQNRGRIEKTEIIEMAIKYMKHLQNLAEPLLVEDGPLGPSPTTTPIPTIDHDQLFVLCNAHSPNTATLLIKDRYHYFRLGFQECINEGVHFLQDNGLDTYYHRFVEQLGDFRDTIGVGVVSRTMMKSGVPLPFNLEELDRLTSHRVAQPPPGSPGQSHGPSSQMMFQSPMKPLSESHLDAGQNASEPMAIDGHNPDLESNGPGAVSVTVMPNQSQYSLNAIKYLIDSSSSSSSAGTPTTSSLSGSAAALGVVNPLGLPNEHHHERHSVSRSNTPPLGPHNPLLIKSSSSLSDQFPAPIPLDISKMAQPKVEPTGDSDNKSPKDLLDGARGGNTEKHHFKKNFKDRFQNGVKTNGPNEGGPISCASSRNTSSVSSFTSECANDSTAVNFPSGSMNPPSGQPAGVVPSSSVDTAPAVVTTETSNNVCSLSSSGSLSSNSSSSTLSASETKSVTNEQQGSSMPSMPVMPPEPAIRTSASLLQEQNARSKETLLDQLSQHGAADSKPVMTLSTLLNSYSNRPQDGIDTGLPDAKKQKFVQVFALHPCGRYYVPMEIEATILGMNCEDTEPNMLSQLEKEQDKLYDKQQQQASKNYSNGDGMMDEKEIDADLEVDDDDQQQQQMRSKRARYNEEDNEIYAREMTAYINPNFTFGYPGAHKPDSFWQHYPPPCISPTGSEILENEKRLFPINITVNVAFNRKVTLASLSGKINEILVSYLNVSGNVAIIGPNGIVVDAPKEYIRSYKAVMGDNQPTGEMCVDLSSKKGERPISPMMLDSKMLHHQRINSGEHPSHHHHGHHSAMYPDLSEEHRHHLNLLKASQEAKQQQQQQHHHLLSTSSIKTSAFEQFTRSVSPHPMHHPPTSSAMMSSHQQQQQQQQHFDLNSLVSHFAAANHQLGLQPGALEQYTSVIPPNMATQVMATLAATAAAIEKNKVSAQQQQQQQQHQPGININPHHQLSIENHGSGNGNNNNNKKLSTSGIGHHLSAFSALDDYAAKDRAGLTSKDIAFQSNHHSKMNGIKQPGSGPSHPNYHTIHHNLNNQQQQQQQQEDSKQDLERLLAGSGPGYKRDLANSSSVRSTKPDPHTPALIIPNTPVSTVGGHSLPLHIASSATSLHALASSGAYAANTYPFLAAAAAAAAAGNGGQPQLPEPRDHVPLFSPPIVSRSITPATSPNPHQQPNSHHRVSVSGASSGATSVVTPIAVPPVVPHSLAAAYNSHLVSQIPYYSLWSSQLAAAGSPYGAGGPNVAAAAAAEHAFQAAQANHRKSPLLPTSSVSSVPTSRAPNSSSIAAASSSNPFGILSLFGGGHNGQVPDFGHSASQLQQQQQQQQSDSSSATSSAALRAQLDRYNQLFGNGTPGTPGGLTSSVPAMAFNPTISLDQFGKFDGKSNKSHRSGDSKHGELTVSAASAALNLTKDTNPTGIAPKLI